LDEELACADTLDPNETLTQDHFINFVLSDLKKNAENWGEAKAPDRTGRAHRQLSLRQRTESRRQNDEQSHGLSWSFKLFA
jgi:hypothetical protein